MKRIAIFMFWDDRGIVYDYVTYLLKDLLKNVDELHIVANGYLREESRDLFLSLTPHLLERPNEGYDAAAWRACMVEECGFARLRQFDELILLNDSFFGPFRPFGEIFAEMESRGADFWGMSVHGAAPGNPRFCEGGVRPRYLQTYFLVFGKKMLEDPRFEAYWTDLPEFKSFTELVERHGCRMTEIFSNMGYSYGVYSDTADLESDDIRKNMSHHMFNTYEMVAHRRLPLIKRKTFTISKDMQFRYGPGDGLARAFEWVRENTSYPVALVWRYLLAKCNLADIHDNLNLYYILSASASQGGAGATAGRRVAIVAHLYYEDLFGFYAGLLEATPPAFDLIVTTSSEKKKAELESRWFAGSRHSVKVLVAGNRGRELSALLVTCKGIPLRYDYLCFVHDKKSSQKEFPTVGSTFGELISVNMIASRNFVENVVALFEKKPELGLLVPPNVYWGTYFHSMANLWTICFDQALGIMRRLGLSGRLLDKSRQPVSVGTCFWCRTDALEPLFNEDWKAEDFPEEPLAADGTLSHGLERVIPYIAQESGYATGTLMTVETATAEVSNFRYMANTALRRSVGLGVRYDTFFHYGQSLSQMAGTMRAARRRTGTATTEVEQKLERASYEMRMKLAEHPFLNLVVDVAKKPFKALLPQSLWVGIKRKFYKV